MTSVRKALLALLLVTTVLAAACSSQRPQSTDEATRAQAVLDATAQTSGNTVGAIGIQLILPGGHHFSLLTYSLHSGAYSLSGSASISISATLNVTLGGVPAGGGYALSLSTTSDDGAVICSFPAPGDPPTGNITISAQTTTLVSVNMQCLSVAGLEAGALSATGLSSNCAQWTSIVATPIGSDGGAVGGSTTASPTMDAASVNVVVGQSLSLAASAFAPDLTQLTFAWTAPAGSFSSSSGTTSPIDNDAGLLDQTTFTCPAVPGPVVLSLSVSDGPVPEGGGCDSSFTQGSITVNCQAAGDAGGTDSGPDAGDGATDAAGG